jgi:hypothetical protein
MQTPVIRVQCSRCHREELRDVEKDIAAIREGKAFVAKLGDREIHFDDLCAPCLRTIGKLLDNAGKKIEAKAPDRAPTTVEPKRKAAK